MDYTKIIDDAYLCSNDIKNTKEYQRYISLYNLIEKELKKEIDDFKNAEAKYNEAKKYGNYHPDLKKYQLEFVNAKMILYSNQLVIDFFKAEEELNKLLDDFSNDVKSAISNKY